MWPFRYQLLLLLAATLLLLYEARGPVKVSFYAISTNSFDEINNKPSFPDSPTETGYIDNLDLTRNLGDGHVTRIQSYFIAPQSGAYRFVVASDDESKVYLSPNDQESDKKEIIFQNGRAAYQQWDRRKDQKSSSIYLTVGTKYYIEGVLREETGADHLSIGVYFPDGTTALPITNHFLEIYH